ncbi:hypothetical protein J437_LFUL002581, partial [Ladona fulva]
MPDSPEGAKLVPAAAAKTPPASASAPATTSSAPPGHLPPAPSAFGPVLPNGRVHSPVANGVRSPSPPTTAPTSSSAAPYSSALPQLSHYYYPGGSGHTVHPTLYHNPLSSYPAEPSGATVGASSALSPTSGRHAIQGHHHHGHHHGLSKVKRFLTTLVQFGADLAPETGERVRSLVHGLLFRLKELLSSFQTCTMSVEEFHRSLQDVTNFPLRPFVLPFLRLHLPPLQRELSALARIAKK